MHSFIVEQKLNSLQSLSSFATEIQIKFKDSSLALGLSVAIVNIWTLSAL